MEKLDEVDKERTFRWICKHCNYKSHHFKSTVRDLMGKMRYCPKKDCIYLPLEWITIENKKLNKKEE